MISRKACLALAASTGLLPAFSQYDTIFVGDPEAISLGPLETPFPTGGARTSRTQYLFQSSELMGFFPNVNVEGLFIDVLDTDPPGTTVDLRISMKNTTQTEHNDLEYTGLTTVDDTSELHLQAGTLFIPFNTPWQWMGPGINMLVEFCIQRNGAPGVDPRVMLDTSFTFLPTYYVHDTSNSSTCNNLTTFSFPGLIHDNFDSRPVMGFLWYDPTTAITGAIEKATRVAVYPNPAKDRLRLRVLDGPKVLTAEVFNALGSLAQRSPQLASDNRGFVEIPLSDLDPGCYLLKITDGQGRTILVERFLAE